MKNKVIKAIEEEKLIVIVRGVKKEKLIPLAEAMYEGGVRLLEITYDAKGIVTDEETTENIKMLATHFDGRMYIGAGTVLKESQAELTKNAGGTFIISPDTNPDVIKKTAELGLVSIPGALTPSEIQRAHINGADFVKLFPVTSMGVEYVKAVSAPLSHVKLLAVGGVGLDNIPDYLKSGVCGFGLGSLAEDDYKTITELAKQYTMAVK